MKDALKLHGRKNALANQPNHQLVKADEQQDMTQVLAQLISKGTSLDEWADVARELGTSVELIEITRFIKRG